MAGGVFRSGSDEIEAYDKIISSHKKFHWLSTHTGLLLLCIKIELSISNSRCSFIGTSNLGYIQISLGDNYFHGNWYLLSFKFLNYTTSNYVFISWFDSVYKFDVYHSKFDSGWP